MSVDFSELEKLFDLARRTDPDERQELIETVCGANHQLKAKINELLQADSTHDEMLDSRAAIADLLTGDFPKPGWQIGPYRLEKVIGSGGMATVFLASQQAPIQRRVALKIVKESRVCRKAIGRFEAEKQALATIDHPFVTKIFDAGVSEDGLFYFSMEYVDGKAITKYCDDQAMGLKERLQLFCKVCEGIEHAHQKGIVHRDLKPSNILVSDLSGKPQPKVIDFGIAKALDSFRDEVEFLEATRDGIMIGTPQYMSPEQADMRHESIDSRADVYSLGVVLHELITGATPMGSLIKDKGLLKAFELAKYSAIPSPTAKVLETDDSSVFECRGTCKEKLLKVLKSDLEAVILKATNGNPEQRYQTAQAFRDDVERFCKGQPVHAARFDVVSHMKKWVSRNRVFTSAAALILIAVSIAASVSIYHAKQATDASRENDSLRARFVEDQKELCEASYFRERVEQCRLAKQAHKNALDRYLTKNSWVTHVSEEEAESTMASFHSLLESNLKSCGLCAIIPSEFNLEQVDIPLVESTTFAQDPMGMGPFGGGTFSIAFSTAGEGDIGMFDSAEDIVERQNNRLCSLIYEEQKKLLGGTNEVVANTCDIWAQYLMTCDRSSKAIGFLEEAATIRKALGTDLYKGPVAFNLLLQAKCNFKLRNRKQAGQLMDQASAAMVEIENAKHKETLAAFRSELRVDRNQRAESVKVMLRNVGETFVRTLFIP